MLFRPGDLYAGFTIGSLLGIGGSSEVYLADDGKGPLALKIMNTESSRSELARLRFIHEFEIAVKLSHPNIVQMFAHGECDGRLWSSHEYIDGAEAKGPLRNTEPDPTLAVAILTGIAHALDYAHIQRVVHLDVKPANMLISRSAPETDEVPEAGPHDPDPKLVARVKLSDFGTARPLDGVGPKLVRDGFVVGSLPYAAPELLRGQPVRPATDQYALACAAAELLTGEVPFPITNRLKLAEAQVHAAPPDISRRRAWIPSAVGSILRKCLAKDPHARYSSCAEPIRMIARALRDINPYD
ncbi:serine/threonine-protein kinase [Nocardia alni]|uniref:serine/threonine-protein kinase n=1 Tax=Nocardia alni TaxID=2815723 RepID=UPI001C228CCA|nr:serine/threonine-protein kinase [Nocardia alni]